MHHFLYPTSDTYISNKPSEKNKNFGIDELLSIGVGHNYYKTLNTSKTYHFGNEYVSGIEFENYTGIFTGSFFGISSEVYGTIVGNSNRFTASYFSGSISGSLMGFETGSPFTSSNFQGNLVGYSGNVESYTINGFVSGSLIANCFSVFTGQLTQSVGNATGYVFGDEIKNEQYYTTVDKKHINRALIKFDLSFISQSIVSGDIVNPKFYLKLKSTEARELPTEFSIFAFPVSQSWDQGDGYFSDGGSNEGVSWNWRDSYSGSSWFTPTEDTIITSSVDYLGDYNYVSESFTRGGGTWHNVLCSQSFSYEVSDINMDVTPIVTSWLTEEISNDGFILMYSGETDISSSNVNMFFFSHDTNTIYSPKLDIAWDDSVWITGSIITGSVVISTYSPRVSGSISSGSVISNIIATGSFLGSSYLSINSEYSVNSGSMISVVGNSGTINGLIIEGLVLGTSSYVDVNGISNVTMSLTSGDFSGCEIMAQYSSSIISGVLSGSYTQQFLTGHEIYDSQTIGSITKQYSPAPGNLLGSFFTGSTANNDGIFQGIVTSGLLQGALVTIPFTGSFSYVTSSFSFTSSVEMTSSVLQPVSFDKPFVVVIQDLKNQYSFGDIPRIGVFAREQFPLKTFDKLPQQLVYTTPKILPTSSYYSIKDNETEEIIVGFDNYTRLSSDLSGNYFYLDTTALAQERYYKILIRTESEGKIYTFDSDNLFKVRR